MPAKFTVFINASSRRAEAAIPGIKAVCNEQDITTGEWIIARGGAQMDAALQRLENDPPHYLLVGGGDGTIVNVIERLQHQPVTIGIIPLGTTNNFARNLEIPIGPATLELIPRDKPEPLWLGQANDQLFVNVASIGISAHVAHTVSDRTKRLLGRGAYLLSGLRWLLTHRPFAADIVADGERYHIHTHQIVIAKGRYHSGLIVSERASLNRDELALLALGTSPSRWRHLASLVNFVRGRHHEDADSLLIHAKRFEITTEPVTFVETDGEVELKTPLDIRLIKTECQFYLP